MAETTLHTNIASDVFPNGAWLYCDEPGCDRGERITSADATRYLAHGWPLHHGRTMTLTIAPPSPTPETET